MLGSHNMSMAAWGHLDASSQQLKILNYELGVLLLPSLEAAYQRHPHRGFSCTAAAAQGGASGASGPPAPAGGAVEFWSLAGAQLQEAREQEQAGGAAAVRVPLPLPLPYPLPPQRYGPDDKPWAYDRPDCGGLLDAAGLDYAQRRPRGAGRPGRRQGAEGGAGEEGEEAEEGEEEEQEEQRREECWSWARAAGGWRSRRSGGGAWDVGSDEISGGVGAGESLV
jgi:tyrosyl-DNA phosphodiesterase-1